jgi:predicted acyltransferase
LLFGCFLFDDEQMASIQTVSPAETTVVKPARVLSVDVLRGITIALMILVNDPGDWGHVFAQLDHATWNGWTLTDTVFPTFLFLMGASIMFSFEARASRGNCKKTLAGHIFFRAAKIFVLYWLMVFFPKMHWTVRLFGVLPRIALCYLLVALLLLFTRRVRVLVVITAVLLVGYWVLLRWVPVPGLGMPGRDIPFMDQNANLASWIDRGFSAWTLRWLHTGTLYRGTRDPEGLLSTLPALATTLLGSLTGIWMLRSQRDAGGLRRMRPGLVFAGVIGVAAGELWSFWFPINKNLWTSSYVLLMAGLAAIALALCSWWIDGRSKPWPRWLQVSTWPWLVFGSNAILAYTVSIVLVKTGAFIKIADPQGEKHSLLSLTYRNLFASHGSTDWTSLAFAVCFVMVCFLPNWLLWRKKIFLKL